MRIVAPFLLASILCIPAPAPAQQSRVVSGPPHLHGVYQAVPAQATLPGGLKNSGSPAAIELLPAAARQVQSIDLKSDPWKMCQPVGPFRMMAVDRAKIELVQESAWIGGLFEDLTHGMMRNIYLRRGHPAKLQPTWLGDSVGRWDGDTLVVDTTGLNDQTWLNEKGAQHSPELHLVERIRLIPGGEYLEYKMTAEDPKSLAKPYSYTRYYKRLDSEIMDDPCEDEQ